MWNEEDAEDEVLAMVARTGLRTTMGNLLRQVMCPLHATRSSQDTFVVVSIPHRLKPLVLGGGKFGGGGGGAVGGGGGLQRLQAKGDCKMCNQKRLRCFPLGGMCHHLHNAIWLPCLTSTYQVAGIQARAVLHAYPVLLAAAHGPSQVQDPSCML